MTSRHRELLIKAANLEQEVNNLHMTLASADRTVSTDEQFLAKDRDIRELMGARQLYIADVLDVQHDGRPSKPFGRVFYTKVNLSSLCLRPAVPTRIPRGQNLPGLGKTGLRVFKTAQSGHLLYG